MKVQYIEIFRNKERVYQGVAFGEKDVAEQIDAITRGAVLNDQRIVQQSSVLYDILDAGTGEVWGEIVLRKIY